VTRAKGKAGARVAGSGRAQKVHGVGRGKVRREKEEQGEWKERNPGVFDSAIWLYRRLIERERRLGPGDRGEIASRRRMDNLHSTV